ncbi:MAG TPA: DUF2339 domain-containing protein, partial [Vicinamibacteria bacterium]
LHWLWALDGRPDDAASFVDRWALVLWGLLVVTVALAMELRAADPERSALRSSLWTFAGVQLFLGVTWELMGFFGLFALAEVGSPLAAGLAVSAWWLCYAGVAIWVGFRTGIKGVRVAGLAVSGLAIAKVLLFDLRELDALYRVGSVFLLGLVSLLVAWAYHRRARQGEMAEADRLQG